ncbi:MAG: DUF4296 domain-containing protein [Polaribacter sp.]|jgi:hypothetical protein|nr:DUF4296 domain-containing protein [Polaribacter sp.]
MKNSITYLILIVLFASCRSNTIYEEPKDLIPKDSMMMLLKDLYLATAAKNIKNKRQQKKVSYITLVYNKYNIDSLRFNTSNLYYTSKIDIYEPMLNEITELLEKEQEFFTKAKKIKDSLYNDSLKNISYKIKKEQKIKELKKVDILKKTENLKQFQRKN